MTRPSPAKLITLSAGLLLLFAEPAWALQSHSAPEGIYVHQMAHLLFVAALSYLYWHTRKTQELTSRGWKFLQLFCLLLIFWNILAFCGHEIFELLGDGDFISKDTWNQQLAPPISALKILYYLTKMDHFLLVPALLSLVISLRTFYLEAKKEASR